MLKWVFYGVILLLRKLNLINFRNYKRLNITFSKNINIFIGNNAQGKTNIIESIYFLAITKSFRTTNDSNLINDLSDITKVKGEIKVEDIYKTLSIELTPSSKKVKVNENPVKKISDYITNFNVIISSPEDRYIINGTPAERRNFLNVELSQISRSYLKKYNEFNKLLKIRNDYLKMLFKSANSDQRYLDSLTDNLIEREILIYQERKKFIDRINERIGEIYKKIAGIIDLKIIYEPNIEFSSFDTDNLSKVLKEKYRKTQRKEMENGTTLHGPHRDELRFLIENKDIKMFGSVGQQKLATIALKLAEIEVFKEETQTLPILLLDDVFSELDKKNQNRVIKYIIGELQVIIATNDTRGISKKLLNSAKIYEVKGCTIEEKGERDNGRK